MATQTDDTYQAEFRYVFFAPPGAYDATVAFYRDILEFPLFGGFDEPEHGRRGAFFQAAGGSIEVIEEAGDAGQRAELFGPGDAYAPPRGGYLLIEVPDVDGLYERAANMGSRILQRPCTWPWGYRDFKVEDPSGNMLAPFSRRTR